MKNLLNNENFSNIVKDIFSNIELDNLSNNVFNILDLFFKNSRYFITLFDKDRDNDYQYIAYKIDSNSEGYQKDYLDINDKFQEILFPKKITSIKDVEKLSSFINYLLIDSQDIAKNGLIAIPLTDKNRAIGTIFVFNNINFNQFDLISKLSEYISIAFKNSINYQSLLEVNKKDSLTGLFNYKEFLKLLKKEKSISDRYKTPFSVIFVDIDSFKLVNDNYGHLTGSKLIIEVSQILSRDLRQYDYVTRYGGDEYMILLHKTSKDQAVTVANRLKTLIKDTKFLTDDLTKKISITASFGVATYPEDGDSIKKLIDIADENMYFVKNNGKNGVKG